MTCDVFLDWYKRLYFTMHVKLTISERKKEKLNQLQKEEKFFNIHKLLYKML